MHLLDVLGTALSLQLAAPAVPVQLLPELPEPSLPVLHVCPHLLQAVHVVALHLLPALGLLSRLKSGSLERLCLQIYDVLN